MSKEELRVSAVKELAACMDNGVDWQKAANQLFYEEHQFDALFEGMDADEEWELVNDLIVEATAKLELLGM